MALPIWNPPNKIVPSETYLGEPTKDSLHMAVGSALDEWENVESVLARIFGLLVQSRSVAALRAYGTITSASGRKEALKQAAVAFFYGKPDPMMADYYSLFNAYASAAQFRNNIAHGISYGYVYFKGVTSEPGWFLFPPQYNTRKRKSADAIGSAYIYKVFDIEHCKERFSQLYGESNFLEEYLRDTYPLL
jgi:hypothetical protein